MYLLENGIKLRETTPFRHGILIGGLFEDTSLIVRLDVADPIGVELAAPDTGRPFKFSQPSIGAMLIKKDDRSSSCFFPLEALARLQANADELVTMVGDAWREAGGDEAAISRNLRALISALNGDIHRVDSFGVVNWAPSLSMPFGIVLAGPWMGQPEIAEPLTYTIPTQETAQ
jgi:hypothetical protein